jgi:hypothetical protein
MQREGKAGNLKMVVHLYGLLVAIGGGKTAKNYRE